MPNVPSKLSDQVRRESLPSLSWALGNVPIADGVIGLGQRLLAYRAVSAMTKPRFKRRKKLYVQGVLHVKVLLQKSPNKSTRQAPYQSVCINSASSVVCEGSTAPSAPPGTSLFAFRSARNCWICSLTSTASVMSSQLSGTRLNGSVASER